MSVVEVLAAALVTRMLRGAGLGRSLHIVLVTACLQLHLLEVENKWREVPSS